MLLIRRIEITNFACFDRIAIRPVSKPRKALDSHPGGERLGQDHPTTRNPLGDVR